MRPLGLHILDGNECVTPLDYRAKAEGSKLRRTAGFNGGAAPSRSALLWHTPQENGVVLPVAAARAHRLAASLVTDISE